MVFKFGEIRYRIVSFPRFYLNKAVVMQLLVKMNDLGIIKLNLVKLDTELFHFYLNEAVVIQLLVEIIDLGIIKLNFVKLYTELFHFYLNKVVFIKLLVM